MVFNLRFQMAKRTVGKSMKIKNQEVHCPDQNCYQPEREIMLYNRLILSEGGEENSVLTEREICRIYATCYADQRLAIRCRKTVGSFWLSRTFGSIL